jgi:hypothetical protein
MAKPAIGYRDRIAAATVTASSQLSTLPATHLQHPHVSRVWRTGAAVTSASILADFGASYSTGWTAVAGLNLSATGTVRVRFSTVDATGAAGDAYDSGVISPGGVDPAYRLFAHLIPGSPTGRYLRLDISDATLGYIEAGRWWAGRLLQSERSSYEYGFRTLTRDLGARSVAETGQVWVEERGKQRGFQMTFPSFSQDDYEAHLEILQRLHGMGDDMMVMRDPDASNLGRETIVGTIESPLDLSLPSFRRWAFGVTVYERL